MEDKITEETMTSKKLFARLLAKYIGTDEDPVLLSEMIGKDSEVTALYNTCLEFSAICNDLTQQQLVEKDKEIERLSKWNLSEEKPKSEVPVLAIIKGNKIPVRVMWVEKFSLSSDEWEFNGEEDYNEENDTYYWPEGWYEWNEMEEVHWMCKDVLFWMDMPQIPESLNK